jgi:uncharacterized BrkB/YihY/UPF0761 family membrane protein
MIFGGFTHPIYNVYYCIASLGAEQLFFYLLYSFVPTNKQEERELFLSTVLKRSLDKFIVLLCISCCVM